MVEAPPVEELSDPRAQRLADLAKPGRANAKAVLIEDPETLLQCLRSGVDFLEVYHQADRPPQPELAELCAARRVPLAPVAPAVVNRVFKADRKPHVFGAALVPRPATLGRLLEAPGDIVVLDGVRITGNIGAIVRSATALGAAGVVLLDSGIASVADRRLLRASRGHVFSIPVVLAEAPQLLAFLETNRIPALVFGASAEMGLADAVRDPGRHALVFGSERQGPSALLRGARATPVSVPMTRGVESLNVSVCVGVALHERLRERRGITASAAGSRRDGWQGAGPPS
ncbi:MAG: NshR/TsnR family 23S rRNA methyltransferase [Bifidobacteriaceae bacterium]|jgi:TrmH family RNA methyltransferase|nr:NshR/TsnR family 23S rRNA methyltransferase [Bifidobacteriaceae bacterium]